jgi:hypothetical protein
MQEFSTKYWQSELIQQHTKKIIPHDQFSFNQVWKDGSTYVNWSMLYNIQTKGKTGTIWSSQSMQKKPLIKSNTLFLFFIFLLFICAYKAWLISPPCPHPLPYHPLRPLPTPPSIPSRNYFALISTFVVERV